jgi:hypothetical protein
VSDDNHKTFIYKEKTDHHEQQADETAVSGNHMQTCKFHDSDCPNPELCVQNCANFAATCNPADEIMVPIVYRLLEPDEAYCESCSQSREQDVAVRPLRFAPDDHIWFASEVCRTCGYEHPGFYDDGYVARLREWWGWSVVALEPTPAT